jgi:hypothetical protein
MLEYCIPKATAAERSLPAVINSIRAWRCRAKKNEPGPAEQNCHVWLLLLQSFT